MGRAPRSVSVAVVALCFPRVGCAAPVCFMRLLRQESGFLHTTKLGRTT
jgi:hypothetical protein